MGYEETVIGQLENMWIWLLLGSFLLFMITGIIFFTLGIISWLI